MQHEFLKSHCTLNEVLLAIDLASAIEVCGKLLSAYFRFVRYISSSRDVQRGHGFLICFKPWCCGTRLKVLTVQTLWWNVGRRRMPDFLSKKLCRTQHAITTASMFSKFILIAVLKMPKQATKIPNAFSTTLRAFESL